MEKLKGSSATGCTQTHRRTLRFLFWFFLTKEFDFGVGNRNPTAVIKNLRAEEGGKAGFFWRSGETSVPAPLFFSGERERERRWHQVGLILIYTLTSFDLEVGAKMNIGSTLNAAKRIVGTKGRGWVKS